MELTAKGFFTMATDFEIFCTRLDEISAKASNLAKLKSERDGLKGRIDQTLADHTEAAASAVIDGKTIADPATLEKDRNRLEFLLRVIPAVEEKLREESARLKELAFAGVKETGDKTLADLEAKEAEAYKTSALSDAQFAAIEQNERMVRRDYVERRTDLNEATDFWVVLHACASLRDFVKKHG
jgi:hypothetical protein